ncbi:hypothetical protein [Moorena sp. SIO3E8]|nr:hypothetical protein [Moorena sp. SIO3E8]
MPRKAYLAPHFSSDQLKQKYLKTTEPVASRRWHLNRESVFGLDSQE